MAIPEKSKWRVSGSGGDQRLAIDNSYAKAWMSDPSDRPWLQIDLGEIVTLGGLEVYWGKRAARNYRFEVSCEGEAWTRLCGTRHGEGGQEVFAFPPMVARFVRWASDDSLSGQILEIVEINLYGPGDAASTAEATHLSVFGGTPVMVEPSQSITLDFGYLRSIVGAVIEWGESFGTVFSVLVSKDGKAFREVGRMTTGDGGTDNFWWPTTDSRYLRLSVLETSSCHSATLNEFKPRILDKDRMPIGQLERAARAGRADLYPQSLLGRQVYSKPSYSYWDDFFALSAWRNCEYLALEIGDREVAEFAASKGKAFAADLARSLRMTSEQLGRGVIAASADREDVDPTSTSIAFEPCRVEDVLPGEFISATYDLAVTNIAAPDAEGRYTPYILRNINALVALGRLEDAFQLLSVILAGRRPQGWRHWAEVVWNPTRTPEYIGDMPHTWIGAEFSTTVRRMLVREDGDVLELFRAVPDHWWDGDGITLLELPTAFGPLTLRARRRESGAIVELKFDGPEPERVTICCPGARLAHANGRLCTIEGDVIILPKVPAIWLDIWVS